MDERVLTELLAAAKERTDLGQKDRLATFSGRIVKPGDTTEKALARPALNELEGGSQVPGSGEALKTAAKTMVGGAGLIAPTANKVLQSTMSTLSEKAPALVKRVQDAPELIHTYLRSKLGGGDVGSFQVGNYGPAGRTGTAQMVAEPGGNLAKSTAHELSHADTEFGKRSYTTAPQHKLETAAQVGVMLPPEQRNAMNRYVVDPAAKSWDPKLGSQTRMDPETKKPYTTNKAYHEAMAYLTESLLDGKAAPEMEALAKSLTRNIR